MERAERHDRAALGRIAELVFALVIVVRGHKIPRHVLAQRVGPLRPAVRQHEPLGIGMPVQLDAYEVAQFPLGPIRRRHDFRDAVHLGIVGGNLSQDAAQQMIAVEGEIVRDQERAGERTVIRADADDVAGVEIAENILTNFLQRGRLHENEDAAVRGQVGPEDGGAERPPSIGRVFRARSCQCPSGPRVSRAAELARRRASGNNA